MTFLLFPNRRKVYGVDDSGGEKLRELEKSGLSGRELAEPISVEPDCLDDFDNIGSKTSPDKGPRSSGKES